MEIKTKGGLTKLYFHCFHNWDDASFTGAEVKWQGQVLSKEGDSAYLVAVFSWVPKVSPSLFLVPIKEMGHWSFYGSKAEMDLSYKRLIKI